MDAATATDGNTYDDDDDDAGATATDDISTGTLVDVDGEGEDGTILALRARDSAAASSAINRCNAISPATAAAASHVITAAGVFGADAAAAAAAVAADAADAAGVGEEITKFCHISGDNTLTPDEVNMVVINGSDVTNTLDGIDDDDDDGNIALRMK